MNAFLALSPIPRALFALWALLLCLSSIGSAVLAAVKKRGWLVAAALCLFAPVYILWQVAFDLSLSGGRERLAPASAALGGLPWLYWLAALLLLAFFAVFLLGCNLRYDRSFITPGAIKLYLDKVPCGVCCWRDSGRVLFSNVCMNRLCGALTGRPLRNGNRFREATADGMLSVEGRVWRFSCRDFVLDGETLHEMIASDVTGEYAKMQALERDKSELSALNRELREYYLSIDDAVRRQEILQARVNIHDEMNRLMLSSTAADSGDTAALDRIFLLWEQNALLLGMEAEETAGAKASDSLEKLAAALGVRLIRQDALPRALSEPQRSLFYSAAQEALVNAVKHAEAKTLRILWSETETQLCCRLENDGKTPRDAVRFTGGLANLSLLAAKQGASLSVQTDELFTLLLSFPKTPEKAEKSTE